MKEPEADVRAAPRAAKVALAGNPNVGKTTVFNALTGMRQRVGNYPGVTVDRAEGAFEHDRCDVTVVDLPGTYSLTALSADELVTRHHLLRSHPDLVVDVVDASHLERNLYLAVQIMELDLPLLLVLNKSDLAAAEGVVIDSARLAELLGVAVVGTVAAEGRGMEPLRAAIVRGAAGNGPRPATVRYGREVEAEIAALLPFVPEPDRGSPRSARWTALKLLEGDQEVRDEVAALGGTGAAALAAAAEARRRIEAHFGERAEIVIADQRHGFISGAVQECVRITGETRHAFSDKVDEVATRPILGLPLFLLAMFLLFRLVFALGQPMADGLEALFGWLGETVSGFWPAGSADPIRSLLVDGIVAGVGGVLVFLPNVILLFVGVAFLEDSGYMARGAFLMDRFMHKLGLHGRSFVPAMVGFGCTVPAILATRTLDSRRDRMATILVLPLISCGARFPIYALLTAAFFAPQWRARVLMSVYLVGIILAAGLAKLLRSTLFRGGSSAFVMELPPYRMPTLRAMGRHTWDHTRLFLRKAGTLIVGASVVLWVLTNYPKPPEGALAGLTPADRRAAERAASTAGRIGRALEPVMRPVGFDWKATTALLGAAAAKEIFVSQMAILHSLEAERGDSAALSRALRKSYSPLQALCMMLFCLISLPCAATFAATRSETGSWRWALAQAAGLTALAYAVTLVVFQAGSALGLGVA